MTRTRIALVLAAAATLMVAAPANAAPLSTTVPKVLKAERGAKARKGLGLPSYAQILGRYPASIDYSWTYSITLQRVP